MIRSRSRSIRQQPELASALLFDRLLPAACTTLIDELLASTVVRLTATLLAVSVVLHVVAMYACRA